jgi:hypothetical protein
MNRESAAPIALPLETLWLSCRRSCAFLSAVAAASLACGSSHNGLQSLSITPAAADAKNYPSGQVQFTAMGTSAGSTRPAAVMVLWWSYTPWTIPPPAPVASPPTPPTYSLDSNGLAMCQGTGTFTHWATAPTDQSVRLSSLTKSTSQLTATAQLTCP